MLKYRVHARMIAHPETPISWLDAELCARLCRLSRYGPILWDTVAINRYPGSWAEGYDEIVISGYVQRSGDYGQGT